jgi:hypothetical protein
MYVIFDNPEISFGLPIAYISIVNVIKSTTITPTVIDSGCEFHTTYVPRIGCGILHGFVIADQMTGVTRCHSSGHESIHKGCLPGLDWLIMQFSIDAQQIRWSYLWTDWYVYFHSILC